MLQNSFNDFIATPSEAERICDSRKGILCFYLSALNSTAANLNNNWKVMIPERKKRNTILYLIKSNTILYHS